MIDNNAGFLLIKETKSDGTKTQDTISIDALKG